MAISHHRLVGLTGSVGPFRWHDSAHGNRLKTPALPAPEVPARFLLHVLPDGVVRIRHFDLLANRGRTAKLARCRSLLAAEAPAARPLPEGVAALSDPLSTATPPAPARRPPGSRRRS